VSGHETTAVPPAVVAGFEFATAARIVFGEGSLQGLAGLVAPFGRRAMIVTGRRPERASQAAACLRDAGVQTTLFTVPGEPTTHRVREGVEAARQAGVDCLVAFGGGSAIDAAKAIGALVGNGGDLLDYLEVIGHARPLERPALPLIAIPTTAGTGCEVTRNAVLRSPEHRFKVSLRSPHLLPRVALVDPELTRDLPRELTATTALDALTQLIEPFVSSRANPLTDALCREGIARSARSLRAAWRDPADRAARANLSLASLFSGLALANAGLGAVHGFAAPLGGMFPAPHGAVCAALLPGVMEWNLRALRERAPHSPALGRYDEVGRLLTGHRKADAQAGIAWIKELCAEWRVPGLAAYGVTHAHLEEVADKAAQASSMKANPVVLSREERLAILAGAL